MPNSKTEDIKRHGDTLEPLIDRTGSATHRNRNPNDDSARRQDDAEDRRDVGAQE